MSDRRTRGSDDASGTGDIGQLLSSAGDAVSGMFGLSKTGNNSALPPQVQKHKAAIDAAAEVNRPPSRSVTATEAPAGPESAGGADEGMSDAPAPMAVKSSAHVTSTLADRLEAEVEDEPFASEPEEILSLMSKALLSLGRNSDVQDTSPTLDTANRVERSVEDNPFTAPDPEEIGVEMQKAVPEEAWRKQGISPPTTNQNRGAAYNAAQKVEASVENNLFTAPEPEDLGADMQKAVPREAWEKHGVAPGERREGSAYRAAEQVEASVENNPFSMPDPEDTGAEMQRGVPKAAWDKDGVKAGEDGTDGKVTSALPKPDVDSAKSVVSVLGSKLKNLFTSGSHTDVESIMETSHPNTGEQDQASHDDVSAVDENKTESQKLAGPAPSSQRGRPHEGESALDVVKREVAESYKPPMAKGRDEGVESKDVARNIERVDKLDDPMEKRIYEAETGKVVPGARAREDLSSPAEKAKEASSGKVVGLDRVDETGTVPHGKPDKPGAAVKPGTDRFSATSGILGSGNAKAKGPTGKEVKDAQQEILMHDPASGRPHIMGQDTNMAYPIDDPRHPQNRGRPTEGNNPLEKAGEKVELAAKGMYDDVTGGPRAGKDSAGIPGGQLHVMKGMAHDVAETAKSLPEKAGEAAGKLGQVASNLGEYVEKKGQNVKYAANTADTKSVEERVKQQQKHVEEREQQLDKSNPWAEGHEQRLGQLKMEKPAAEQKETLLDHILHPFSKAGDAGPAKRYAKSFDEYRTEKEYDPVGRMQADKEYDTAKLPGRSEEAQQADVNISEGVRGDRTSYIMDRAAKAGHEHDDPLEEQKENLERRVAEKGYAIPHPVWRSQKHDVAGEASTDAAQQASEQHPTQQPGMLPKTMTEKVKEGLSRLVGMGKEAISARGGEGGPRAYDEVDKRRDEYAKDRTATVQEQEREMRDNAPAGVVDEVMSKATDAGIMPGKAVDSATASPPDSSTTATPGTVQSTNPGTGQSEKPKPLMVVGQKLAHLAEALVPHARHDHSIPSEARQTSPTAYKPQHNLPEFSSRTTATDEKMGRGRDVQIKSRDEHATSMTTSVAQNIGTAAGTVEGLRQVFAEKLGHVREALAENAPNIPDVPYTSTDQILQERQQQEQQQKAGVRNH